MRAGGRGAYTRGVRPLALSVLLFASYAQAIGPGDGDKIKAVPASGKGGRDLSCYAVDYSASVPPVRDQGQIGWCYAYVAADLLSYQLGLRVSALDTALTYVHDSKKNDRWEAKMDRPETTIEGGHIERAVGRALDKGLCLDEDVPSDMSFSMQLGHEIQDVDARTHLARLEIRVIDYVQTKPKGPGSGVPFVNTGVAVYNAFASDAEACTPEFKTAALGVDARQRLHANKVCLETYHNAKLRFPGLSRRQYFDALLIATESNILKNLADKACRKRFNPATRPQAKTFWLDRPKKGETFGPEAIATLDAALNRGQIAGIGYDWDLVEKPLKDYRFRRADHASSVIARRANPQTGACEYLIRNSWGVSCEPSSLYPCRAGNYWVPRAALQAGTQSVTVLH